ncbi:MAG: Bifunctional adenosylcobalamin biosynthesis protein CobP [Firmicutes bacterium ADurb.Bin456]|nr:MAG: Bifunctional adenosylcobalamin biosynthesis protein CobP [Firmicutes bacterium ADurb.Bin456]
MKGKLILILGGARSGKSDFAEKLAARLEKRVVYIATASARDEEMLKRIQKHKAKRPAFWKTVEEEKSIVDIVKSGGKGDLFLLDCATLWITNLLLDSNIPAPGAPGGPLKEEWILEQAALLGDSVNNGADLIIVANETGLGLVPEYPLGRNFRDLSGKVNQILAARAEEVYFIIAGLPLRIKPGAV